MLLRSAALLSAVPLRSSPGSSRIAALGSDHLQACRSRFRGDGRAALGLTNHLVAFGVSFGVLHRSSQLRWRLSSRRSSSTTVATHVTRPRHTQIWTVDSFADAAFGGNPAAVCIADGLDDESMRLIAREMNLSETAFVCRDLDGSASSWGLRWFTPTVEVALCGHGTLAAAHALWEAGFCPKTEAISFTTRQSGILTISREESGMIEMNFPADAPVGSAGSQSLVGTTVVRGLGILEDDVMWSGKNETGDIFVEISAELFGQLNPPDLGILAETDARGIVPFCASSSALEALLGLRGGALRGVDFVSRFFGPRIGISEDPVTGSAHWGLGPLWASRLGRGDGEAVVGYQASERGGRVSVVVDGKRALLRGSAVTVLEGKLRLPAVSV
mmetsp:Transcript_76922/g.220260  ORF Transcript_76922/g.220260 Transcript_76922/m.220260 type:complete len:388 (+) Transcript_76922:50-1213(+)